MRETAIAIGKYEPTGKGQIALQEGDFIEVIEKAPDEDGNEDDAWWYGKNLRGKEIGWFPANCVKKKEGKVGFLVEQKQQPQKPPKPVKPNVSTKSVKVENTETRLPLPDVVIKATFCESNDQTKPNTLKLPVKDGSSTLSSLEKRSSVLPPLRLPPQDTTVSEVKPKVGQSTNSYATLKKQTPSTSTDNSSDQQSEFMVKLDNVLKKRSSLPGSLKTHLYSNNYHRNSHNPFNPFLTDYVYEDNDEWEDDEEEKLEPEVQKIEFAVAFASFDPTEPETQLALKVSDIIEIHEKTNSNWWRGKINGDFNSSLKWIPVSCIKLIDLDSLHLNLFERKEEVYKPEYPLVQRSPSLQLFNQSKNTNQTVTTKTSASLSRWDSSISLTSTTSSAAKSENQKNSSSFKKTFSKFFKRSTFLAEETQDKKSSSLKEQVVGEEIVEDSSLDHSSLHSYSQLLYTVHTMGISVKDSIEVRDPKVELEKRRQNIIYDLVATEGKYIKDIYFTLKNFQQPLTSNGLLTDDESKLIFRNLQHIYDANYALYDDLNARFTATGNGNLNSNRICDILLAHLPLMISIYSEYISGHQTAITKLDVKCRDAYFTDFIESVSREHTEYYLPLKQYLTKPMQRLLQLPNLMEQLLKNTDQEEEEEYFNCQTVVDLVKDFCKTMDNILYSPSEGRPSKAGKLWKQFEYLSWLQTHIVYKEVDHFVDFNSETTFLGPRQLLYASFFHDLSTNKPVVLFLLNDLLLIGQPQVENRRLDNVQHVTHFFDAHQAHFFRYKLFYDRPLLLEDISLSEEHSVSDTAFEFTFEPSAIGKKESTRLQLQAATFEQYKLLVEKFTTAKTEYKRIQQFNKEIFKGKLGSLKVLKDQSVAMLSLESIQAVQLYTKSYTLNAYCRVALGTDWSNAHTVWVTKPIYVDLSPHKQTPKTSKTSKTLFSFSPSPPSPEPANQNTIIWKPNYLQAMYSTEERLLIKCYNESRYSPHQLLGETSLALGPLIAASKTLQNFNKGLPLVLPNGQLGEQLMANYKIKPCLFVKFNIL